MKRRSLRLICLRESSVRLNLSHSNITFHSVEKNAKNVSAERAATSVEKEKNVDEKRQQRQMMAHELEEPAHQ